MRNWFFLFLVVPVLAMASGAELHLDRAPNRSNDKAALQNGAKVFCQLLPELPFGVLHAL